MKATWQFSDQTPSGRRFRRYEKVRGALFPNKPRPGLPRRAPVTERLVYWQDELRYWQLEVSFFNSLLHIGIFNCKPDSWYRLDYLRQAFSVYEHEILPDIKTTIENTLADKHNRNELQGKTLQQEIESHAETLKKLKIEVFPYLTELLLTPIW